jgi:anti-sigma B factor antagonist
MKLEVSKVNDVSVLRLEGRLIAGLGDVMLRDEINRLLADDEHKIVIDLSGVSHVDSSGVGELVASRRICYRFGCALRLVQGKAAVERVLDISQVLPLFRIHTSLQAALDELHAVDTPEEPDPFAEAESTA